MLMLALKGRPARARRRPLLARPDGPLLTALASADQAIFGEVAEPGNGGHGRRVLLLSMCMALGCGELRSVTLALAEEIAQEQCDWGNKTRYPGEGWRGAEHPLTPRSRRPREVHPGLGVGAGGAAAHLR